MATAIITITDEGTNITVSVDFGESGGQDDSNAHHMALRAVKAIQQAAGQGYDDEADDE